MKKLKALLLTVCMLAALAGVTYVAKVIVEPYDRGWDIVFNNDKVADDKVVEKNE